jgi:hypothetical protein
MNTSATCHTCVRETAGTKTVAFCAHRRLKKSSRYADMSSVDKCSRCRASGTLSEHASSVSNTACAWALRAPHSWASLIVENARNPARTRTAGLFVVTEHTPCESPWYGSRAPSPSPHHALVARLDFVYSAMLFPWVVGCVASNWSTNDSFHSTLTRTRVAAGDGRRSQCELLGNPGRHSFWLHGAQGSPSI